MRKVAVIMAGGRGERFWPYSRLKNPKQFLDLTGNGQSMIQQTYQRIRTIIETDDVFVVTNSAFVEQVHEQLPEIPFDNIIVEPCARNTAPCIGLAAAVVRRRYGNATMVVLPSDHYIRDQETFIKDIQRCIQTAEETSQLMTMGITPTHPETGYGYLRYRKEAGNGNGIYRVERFVEKPSLEVAKEYLAQNCYLWNSGIFVFTANDIWKHLEELLPDMHRELQKIEQAVDTPAYQRTLEICFANIVGISIDFGVMEKSDDILVVPGDFGWDDVGSWTAMANLIEQDACGNTVIGDAYLIDSTQNIVFSEKGKTIVLLDVVDLVVVDADDAILVCSKEAVQHIRKVPQTLRDAGRAELL